MNATAFVSQAELARWSSEQSRRIASYVRNPAQQAECAMQIAALRGDVGDLPIALLRGSWLNTEEVADWAASHKIVYLVDSRNADKCSGGLKENVLIEAEGFKPLVDISLWDPRWRAEWRRNEPSKNRHPVVRAVARAWRVEPSDVEVWSGEHVICSNRYGDDFPVDVQTLKLESVEFEE